MRHVLSLDVTETNNIKVFRIADTSIYADMPITCGVLQIQAPGFNVIQQFDVVPNFSLVVNACSLGIQTEDCGTNPGNLPDGIYKLQYSVSPNDKVFVEYAHLRTTATMNKYYNLLCDLELAACEPEAVIKDQLEKLREIRSFIDAAKAKAEYCHELDKGMELLKYAQKQLNNFSLNPCASC